MTNTDYLSIKSQDIKNFFKAQGFSVRVSTVQSVKPHKLIQAWGQTTPDFRKEVIKAVYGSIDTVADKNGFNYGNIREHYIWMYQSDWKKILEHFKNI